MSDPLATYLHDHLAGANFGIELLEFLREQHKGDSRAGTLSTLQAEIEEDRKVLQGLIDRTGKGGPVLKEAAGWLAQKLSELKLGRDALGAFEALEAMGLGILGKLKLWRALAIIAEADDRVRGVDYNHLAQRAQTQHDRVEELRLEAARNALMPVTK